MVDEPYREIARLAPEIARCGRCGFCQNVCPVYGVSADESGVARGRIMFAEALVEGKLSLSRENERFFSECVLCRACTETCFSAVKTDEIVLAGRKSRSRMHGVSPVHRYVFERLLPDQRRLARFVRLASTTAGPGLVAARSALRLFGWASAALARAEELSRALPEKFLRERLATRPASRAGAKRAAYFIGCGINIMFPGAGETTVRVLEKLGYNVAVVDHGCCGLPAFAYGDVRSARSLAMGVMDSLPRDPECPIVTDCSTCASFLKEYPKLFPEENSSKSRREAERFASRVRDVTEILAGEEFGRLLGAARAASVGLRRTVSFHDPCHLSRYQKLSPVARQALRSLPGIELIEMKDADRCCGGAGTFALEHADLSLAILREKIERVLASGVETVATTCPACMMQLRSGLAREDAGASGRTVRVRHLVEIAGDCLFGGGMP
jgi:glycolate oxidase iron-sulfur subunit